MIQLHTDIQRRATATPADRSPDLSAQSRWDETSMREPAVGARNAELDELLAPMLGAIVCLAGANAGAVRVIGEDGACFEPVVSWGLPAARGEGGKSPLEVWCSTCAESRNANSECVKSNLCGHEQSFRSDVLGPACRHVVGVPLRHRDRPVGALSLLFEADCRLAPEMTPLLQAIGDLLGVTLDNARLARENLRIRLTNERQMMANEVHDSLAQGLTYMRMRMSLLRDAIRQRDELRAFKLWCDVDDTLGNSQRRLRELITYFRSRMDPQGLLHAMREISERFLDRTGIPLEFRNRAPDLCLPPEREIEVFHIVQEALANVCRHAHAKHVRLDMDRKGDDYEIVIEDDGVGVAAYAGAGEPDDAGHYGLAIMRERAHRLGGKLSLHSATGRGTRVELIFPAVIAEDGVGS